MNTGLINITAMIKDGGHRNLMIKPDMLGKLAESIHNKGFEYVQLLAEDIVVVGFMVTGSQTGERIIILGDGEQNE
ncbi:hypothetical protein M5X00_29870 [Paenibacillus alvei]|uniref:hypothetical protein n=3 Tax=Paenibacillus alvei TaxID=44250 RepID=UPI00028976C6|nr:hypothetical protein [Paenibacillus alvei]EJW14431.1 hypothetical protein PAV_13c00500 [Paenibacillus alvei DSM 29]MCY9758430.1 hypothetical protein [Paenibacillus alvei]